MPTALRSGESAVSPPRSGRCVHAVTLDDLATLSRREEARRRPHRAGRGSGPRPGVACCAGRALRPAGCPAPVGRVRRGLGVVPQRRLRPARRGRCDLRHRQRGGAAGARRPHGVLVDEAEPRRGHAVGADQRGHGCGRRHRDRGQGDRGDGVPDARHRPQRAQQRRRRRRRGRRRTRSTARTCSRSCGASPRAAGGRSCSSPRVRTSVGDALGWWQQAGQVAEIVREVYFPAPPLMRTGAVLASRTMRQKFRQGLAPLHGRRHPARSPRPRHRLPVGARQGRSRGAAADRRLASVREARDARGEAGGRRAAHRQRRHVGLGDLRHRRRGRRQAEGRLRLPMGARPGALRRAGGRRARLQRVARRRADRAAARHALSRRRQVDLEARREGIVGRDGRSPGRAERALRAARRDAGTSGCRLSRARGRAGDRLGAVPRLPQRHTSRRCVRRERRSRSPARSSPTSYAGRTSPASGGSMPPTGAEISLYHTLYGCSP